MKSAKAISVLLVDDDEDDYLLTASVFKDLDTSWDFELVWCPTFGDAVKSLQNCKHDLYIFDYLLGSRTGIDLIGKAVEYHCEEPIILLTGKGDEKIAVEALRLGAADYLIKSELEPKILERCIRYALERTNVLKALRHSERRYKRIFEESKDMLFISDLAGNLLQANQAAVQMTGYSEEELQEIPLSKFLEVVNFSDVWQEVLEGNDIQDHEVKVIAKDGRKRYSVLSASLENDQGTTYIQGHLHDITSRKQSERERLFSEKLAVTSRLVRLLAHEVRNPLTNVNLSAEQLESELHEEDLKFYTQIIKRNCSRINDLITQLLQSSRPSEVTLVMYSLHKVLDETLVAAYDRIHLKKVKIIKDYAPEDIVMPLDKASLQIAFLNLVTNAVEAMAEEDGVLTLLTERTDQDFLVRIIDNGSGISEENMRKVFEPYFTSKKTGMGIGLATTLSIVQSHKGRIDVQSEEGAGTVFTISFPINSGS
jgi:PAS domain S-box-containing protein